MNPKKLRILFVDDENLEVINVLKSEGFDVEHWNDVESLDRIADGRYHVVFLDVRGVGEKYGGNGLDVLRYVATHNPLVYTIVFSAKPFTGTESDVIRQYANRSLTKDCSLYDIVDVLEEYSRKLSPEYVLDKLEKTVKIGFIAKWRIKRGGALTKSDIEKIANQSEIASDAVKVVANITAIATELMTLF